MGTNKTFPLKGSYEQRIILVSAVRYALGRHTYMPSSTREIIEKHMDDLDPATAYIIAATYATSGAAGTTWTGTAPTGATGGTTRT